MNRRLIFLATGAALLGALALPLSASARVQDLHAGDAKSHARQAVKKEMGSQWRYGQGKNISCNNPLSRTKRRCSIRWYAGDNAYRGKSVVRHVDCWWGTCWKARTTVKRIDEYCIHVWERPRSACTKSFSGRARGRG